MTELKKIYCPLHPLFFAAYFILFLFSHNIEELPLSVIWFPIAGAFGLALGAWLIWFLIVKNRWKSSLLATLFIVLFFSFGHFKILLKDVDWRFWGLYLGANKITVTLFFLFFVLGSAGIIKTGRDLVGWNRILNVIGSVRLRSLRSLLGILLPALFFFQILFLIREYSIPSKDYLLQEKAGQAIVAGENSYGGWYIYPPFVCQARAFICRQIDRVGHFWLPESATPEQSWYIEFCLFQCLQFFLALTAYALVFHLGRRLGFKKLAALFWTTVLFSVNNPLFRTLEYNQINLYILNIVLIAILFIQQAPAWCGMAVAVGAHIKLYPMLFVVPWAMQKKWQALAGVVTGFLLIVLIQTGGGQSFDLWLKFIEYYRSIKPLTNSALRDNSIHSLLYNTIRAIELLLGRDGQPAERFISILLVGINAMIVVGFLHRLLQRIKLGAANHFGQKSPSAILMGLSMDTLAAMLLLSPMVWEYHYVLIIPLSLWAMAMVGRRYPVPIAWSHVLIYLIPTFDIYPFSYHRLAGLILLLWCTSPAKTSGAGVALNISMSMSSISRTNRSQISDLKDPILLARMR